MSFYSLIRPLIFQLSPERAHKLALRFAGVGGATYKSEKLKQKLFGLEFSNPVGLSAGFDKNAEAVNGLSKMGFGFLELGTVTPLAQPGNPQPRLFRLIEDEAVINRLGFNNSGLEVFCQNLQAAKRTLPLGANIGKNKDQIDAAADYVRGLEAVSSLADYVTVNISSPNTQGLRDLQEKDALGQLLAALMEKRTKPILLKVAPDLDEEQITRIAEVVLEQKVDGLIVSNTTLDRPESLKSIHRPESGGLSGKPVFTKSNRTLKLFAQQINGKIPLVGVGGIASGSDAYAKIRAGASLVQLYTALVYQGPGLVARINRELLQLLAQDGFNHISEAIGADLNE
ncbi:MAG: quinone-dependent dihydroorotate dehydrogenase [Rickettsiales bacterium]|nr:quinone-dependent dihydroorotate dehydrogenase [Rickettsiales bacterium]